jgi:hypothetical protein
MRVTAIAAREGITPRQVQRIIAARAEAALPLDNVDPDAVVREVLELHDQALSDLAELSIDAPAHVRLGAIVRRVDVGVQRLAILRSYGLVPEYRRWRVARSFDDVLSELAEVLRRHDVPPEALREIVALGDQLHDPPPERKALHAA